MAANYRQLTEDLHCFYDFVGKTVIFVGAGGRQLFDPSTRTKQLVAIDQDVEALGDLSASIGAKSRQDSWEVICAKFETVNLSGDVIYFEFCVHEMEDPEKALTHAKAMAPDIVVFDHLPDSDWAFRAAEEHKIRRSAEAIERFGVRRRTTFVTEQRFQDYAELFAKVGVQGAVARQRAQRFAGATNIVIPMSYQLALL